MFSALYNTCVHVFSIVKLFQMCTCLLHCQTVSNDILLENYVIAREFENSILGKNLSIMGIFLEN